MPAQAIAINAISWTPITSAGQNAICWLIREPAIGRVLIDHSETGTGSLSIDKSYSLASNKEVIRDLLADSSSDIFYAICRNPNQVAVIVVDNIVDLDSSISDQNGSDIPLLAGGTFTGEWIDVTSFGIAYVNIYSDVDSAIDGLIVQQSSDGVNPDHSDEYTIPAMTGKNFAINPHARYLRVIYVNGPSDQTEFRLQLKLNKNGLASSHRIKDDINTSDDARLVKSILSIKANAQNQYKNIELNNPMPVNTGSLFQSDLNLDYSDMGNFSGSPIDLLDNRWSTITDTTANNPKTILLEFERPIQTSIIGITTEAGSFSNTVIKYGLTTSPDITLLDESANSTPKTLLVAPSTPITLTRIKFEFHTANIVTLSGMNLAKSAQSISQLQGIDPSGKLQTIGSSYLGNLKVQLNEYGDTAAIDAFDRLRVSNPFTIFDSKQLYDKQPLFYDERIGGSATSVHSVIDARTRITVTASGSDYLIRQTKQRFNYQPGKSQMIFFTFQASKSAGVTKRIGIFDGTGTNFMTPKNGIFLSITETEVRWNVAKNGVVTESIEQSNWNYDRLDGIGPSRNTLDLNGQLIGIIDFEWLGVGRIRCGFVQSGVVRYVHYFNHDNTPSFISVYMSTPNLPMRYDIQSDGTGGGYLDHICASIISEGGVEETGISRSIDTENVHIDANLADTPYCVLGLRLKTTHLDLTVLPQYISMISETNDDFRWSLLLNPTYNGIFTFSDITNSGCQSARGDSTNSITAIGVQLDSGYAKSAGSIDRRISSSLRLGSKIDGTRDELVLAVTPLSSNSDIQGSLTFRELL